MKVCIEPECDKSVYARERCQQHYNRDVRNGSLPLNKAYHDPLPPQECSVADCNRNIRNDKNGGHGMCGLHHRRWRSHGDAEFVRELEPCSIDACTQRAIARGLCQTHYARWRKHGDPNIVLKPDLSNRPPSRARGVEVGSKHWSCGHARSCDCMESVGECSQCGEILPKREYGMANKDYVSTTCKRCLARIRRERREADPEIARRERANNMLSYRRHNIERRMGERLNDHLRSNLPGSYTIQQRIDLFERYDGLCGYCRALPATDMDHIVPAILHGMEDEQRRLGVPAPTNNIGNFMPACGPCNGKKGSRTLEQWRNNEPMVRRGDIEFPERQHKRMRGPRDATLSLYDNIVQMLDSGLSGADIARQLNIHTSTVTNARKWAGRPPLQRPTQPPRICEIAGCGKRHKAYGLCQTHHLQRKRGLAAGANEAAS